ncbi:MAG: hypothetical protein IJV15_14415 [Lachnospiraceae bacterium]|nr:hypothetical protein [Lachnospiraceae bacterium]
MLRYCANCQKEYDFKIKSMEDLDNLICPECGAKIDKSSRKPAETGANSAEKAVTNVVGGYFTIKYYIHFVLALIGLIAFFIGHFKLLYVMAVLCMIIYLFQFLFGGISFLSGLFFIPLGALIGIFVLGKVFRGICLGIVVVFIIRHLIRGFNYFILSKLIRMGNNK